MKPRKKAGPAPCDALALNPSDVADRLVDTFDPGGTLDPNGLDEWVWDHITALNNAKALLKAPLTQDISREFDRVNTEYSFEHLSPGEWCDLLAAQVDALRELEGASEDVEAPDRQARDRMVKIAAISIACADVLQRVGKGVAA